MDKEKQTKQLEQIIRRIDERVLIETAFNDPDKNVKLLIEIRQTLLDIVKNNYFIVTDWQKVVDEIFLGKDLS